MGGKAQRGRNQLSIVCLVRAAHRPTARRPHLWVTVLNPSNPPSPWLASHGVTPPRYTPSVVDVRGLEDFFSFSFFSSSFRYYLRLTQPRYLVFVSCILQRYCTQRSNDLEFGPGGTAVTTALWTPNVILYRADYHLPLNQPTYVHTLFLEAPARMNRYACRNLPGRQPS